MVRIMLNLIEIKIYNFSNFHSVLDKKDGTLRRKKR